MDNTKYKPVKTNADIFRMYAHLLDGGIVRYCRKAIFAPPYEVNDLNELPINFSKYKYWIKED